MTSVNLVTRDNQQAIALFFFFFGYLSVLCVAELERQV